MYETPIAVDGDVRTLGYGSFAFLNGSQDALTGVFTGTTCTLPPDVWGAFFGDSTTDGTYNELVDYVSGDVHQTDRDYTNFVPLFSAGLGRIGITYDPTDNSLWISDGVPNTSVTDYPLTGTPLGSFSTGHSWNVALALDPADQTLWLVNLHSGNVEQYSKSGALLSTGPNVGFACGGEFNLVESAPEPASMALMGAGALLLLSQRRRFVPR